MASVPLLIILRRKPHRIFSVPCACFHFMWHIRLRCAAPRICLWITERTLQDSRSLLSTFHTGYVRLFHIMLFLDWIFQRSSDLTPPGGIPFSTALHGGMTVGDICTAASWSSTTAFNPPGKCPLSKQQDGRAASPHR
ncbi:hypothetical protein GOODEAATRI_034453 [Goodea atripinnis]|uniref:Uncharacterized protein n=1 Tax=Goodea atripinnis TaxID=208336 RepID=A0ABV0NH47_9TELE